MQIKEKSKRKHRIPKAIVALINQVFTRQIGSYGAFLIDENGQLIDEWDTDGIAAVEGSIE